MKKIAKYIGIVALAFGACATFTSCDDELAHAPYEMPAEEIGDGTWERPLQTWQANLGTTVDGRTSNWVTGYIVGWIDTSVSNTMNAAVIGTPCSVATNMIIAQYPYDEEKWAEMGYSLEDCATVQLPSGAVRTACNLMDNPGNFNRQVSLRGTTGSKYCGAYGVRAANDYNWGPIGRYEEPVSPMGDSYFCNFTASRDINYYVERGWSLYMISGGLSGWYWKENSGVDFVTTSAYLGTATGGPYENWIISPAFDIDNAREKTLSFSTQASTSADSSLEVYVLTHKNPKSCEPVKLECVLAEAPASGYSAWVDSGTIDLSEFSGTIYIGFRYWSAHGGTGNSSDFGMTNFNIGGADPEEWEVIDPATIGTFRKATSITPGKKYAFVFGDNVMCPLSEAYTYGNFGVKELKETGDEISFSKDYAFTLEAAPEAGQYTIQDCYGRYLYMYGTFTNFNVSSTPTPNNAPIQNTYWAFTNDSGVFEIRNVVRDLVLVYDANRNYIGSLSAASYDGQGAVLYELVEE